MGWQEPHGLALGVPDRRLTAQGLGVEPQEVAWIQLVAQGWEEDLLDCSQRARLVVVRGLFDATPMDRSLRLLEVLQDEYLSWEIRLSWLALGWEGLVVLKLESLLLGVEVVPKIADSERRMFEIFLLLGTALEILRLIC